jgi:hypothetical protein
LTEASNEPNSQFTRNLQGRKRIPVIVMVGVSSHVPSPSQVVEQVEGWTRHIARARKPTKEVHEGLFT